MATPIPELKPDQERVRNLLTDTVTLLCKNGLTFKARLRIEGLLGVTIDDHDVFFVHISENFAGAESEASQEAKSPEKQDETVDQSGSDYSKKPSPSEDEVQNSPHELFKMEPATDDDDLLIVEEPKEDILCKFEQSASPAGGQRRRHNNSDGDQGTYGWSEMGEPPRKRQMSASSANYQTSGFSVSEQQTAWPSFAGEQSAEETQLCQVDPEGGNNFDPNVPGCSSWPVQTASQAQAQEQGGPTKKMPEHRLGSMAIKNALRVYLVEPLCGDYYKYLTFRIVWTRKECQNPDAVWENIFNFQQTFSNRLKSLDGVVFFLSAITATITMSSKTVHPALGFWVATDPNIVKESQVYILMRNVAAGAEVKIISQRGDNPVQQQMYNLSVVLKDIGPGYVKQKLDSVFGRSPFPKERIYMKAAPRDAVYPNVLKSTQEVLTSYRMSLGMEIF